MKKFKKILQITFCMLLGIILISTPISAHADTQVRTMSISAHNQLIGGYNALTSNHKLYMWLNTEDSTATATVRINCMNLNVRPIRQKCNYCNLVAGEVYTLDLPAIGSQTILYNAPNASILADCTHYTGKVTNILYIID